MKLVEGQAGACAGTEDIVYPEVNTCMTLTVIYKNPFSIVGGHFSRPVDKMKYPYPPEIIKSMQTKAPKGTMDKAFLIGARGGWELEQMKPLYGFVGELFDDGAVTEYDTFSWKSVNITFKQNGTIAVEPTSSGKKGDGEPPTSWK